MSAGLDVTGGEAVRKILFHVQPARYGRDAAISQRPSLKWAARRCVRRLGIGDLRDVAKTGVLQVFQEWSDEPRACVSPGRFVVAIDA